MWRGLNFNILYLQQVRQGTFQVLLKYLYGTVAFSCFVHLEQRE